MHPILDDWVGLIGVVASSWVTGSTRPTDPHLLRLIAYLVLANRRALGVVGDQAGKDIILQGYTEYLMGQDKPGRTPKYVATSFSAFLTGICDRVEQRLCLYQEGRLGSRWVEWSLLQ